MAIKIPVSASLDTGNVDQQVKQMQHQFNELGKAAASLKDVTFNPIEKGTLEEMKQMTARFEALKKAAPGLAKRLHEAGQGGKNWNEVDWNKAFPDDHQRTRYMQTLVNILRDNSAKAVKPGEGGVSGHGGGSTPPPRDPPGTSAAGDEARRQGRNIASSALGGLGGAGNAASGALNTALVGGAGAGLVGLLGGLAAFGVGKAVGAATEKIGAAEQDQIDYDRLKRAIGDVNVSFEHLKESVRASAEGMHVTWEEGQKLAASFTKLGNVSEDNYKQLADELSTGGGLSRALGLDPQSGVSFLGEMRGVRLTGDADDSRRLALMIGEAVGKSDAFAKADEVMNAISNFASSQARQSLSNVNIAGYAGLLSALTGSGQTGLDVAGSAAVIGQAGQSLRRGGANGEASQFFSATVGRRYGLDPFQARTWNEGGPFATLSTTFGEDSIAGRYGMVGPGGDMTLLRATLEELRRQYGGHNETLAAATANHLGLSMGQAMALLDIKPNEMGSLRKRLEGLEGFDMSRINAASLGTLSKIEDGGRETWTSVANDLRSRTGSDALSSAEREALDRVMAGQDQEAIKNELARLVATRDQGSTQGKDIRDSKVALENLKTAVASKLVPFTQDIRAGVLYMAGDGKMSSQQLLEKIARNDASHRMGKIEASTDQQLSDLEEQRRKAVADLLPKGVYDLENEPFRKHYIEKMKAGTATEADRQEYQRKAQAWEQDQVFRSSDAGHELLDQTQEEFDKRRQAIVDDKKKRLEAEKARLQEELDRIEKTENQRLEEAELRRRQLEGSKDRNRTGAAAADVKVAQAGVIGKLPVGTSGQAATLSPTGGTGEASRALFASILEQESGTRHRNPDGTLVRSPAGALGISQLMPGTARDPGYGILGIQNDSRAEYERVGQAYIDAMLREFGGNRRKALAAYNAGPGRVKGAVREFGDEWLDHLPSETQNYVDKVLERVGERKMPKDLALSQRAQEHRFRFDVPSVDVTVRNERGEPMAPPQQLQPKVSRPKPFGVA
ncbi:transglycosylase SLT domain-containing protein [Afifella aestuarii]|uniref:transglycosylase SLT domain-containing protein n=1 Tax=Afifella aestuarii TaxID=1909496 RepID=UPI000FE35CFB|nr:transglycosylase SLT domain-containing protein [Afifella aestuarii]